MVLPILSGGAAGIKKLLSGNITGNSGGTADIINLNGIVPKDVYSLFLVDFHFTKTAAASVSLVLSKNGTSYSSYSVTPASLLLRAATAVTDAGSANTTLFSGDFTSNTDFRGQIFLRNFNKTSSHVVSATGEVLLSGATGGIIQIGKNSSATTDIDGLNFFTSTGAHSLVYDLWGIK